MSQAVQVAQKIQAYRSVDKFGVENLTLSQSASEALTYGQVRVKMRAASLNYRDLMIVAGTYAPNQTKPAGLIPLSDGAGEVIDVGQGVTGFKVGDRVASLFFQKWLGGQMHDQVSKSALAGIIDGVLATEKIFDENGLIHLPPHLSFEEGATLPCAALTAWNALVYRGKLKAGESVLVLGTGGVSIFALQLAKLSGATVIITSSSDDKLERAKQLGADYLINYSKEADWEKKLREIIPKGVDHVVEVGGAGTLAKSLKAVRFGGKIALIGVLAGNTGEINPMPIYRNNITVNGIYVGSREMFEQMNAAITATKLKPVIDRIFTFADTKEAFNYMQSGSHFGKVVIKIS